MHIAIDRRIIDLVLYKTYADLRAEAERTYISYLWWVVDPVLTMLVFYVVFGLILERGGEGFVPFLLIGLVFWQWYRHTVSRGCDAITTGRGLMNQVHVPKYVFPLVRVLTNLTKFCFVLVLLLAFLWVAGYGAGPAYLALPALLAVQLLFSAALAYLLAALVPYLPDLRIIVDNALQLQFFLSGIFYSVDRVPDPLRAWFFVNPMAGLLDDYRNVLLHDAWPDWGRLAITAVAGALLLVLALGLMHRLDRHYPRVVR